jgi:hypothetical protein
VEEAGHGGEMGGLRKGLGLTMCEFWVFFFSMLSPCWVLEVKVHCFWLTID